MLLSGGIDSAVCLYLARATVSADLTAVSVGYDQKQSPELRYAARMAERAGVPWRLLSARPWSWGGGAYWARPVVDGDPMVTPHRNAVLITLAAAATEPDEIWLGCNADDQADYADCRPVFAKAMGAALGVRVRLPLAPYTKRQVVGWASELGVPLDETLSCYRGKWPGCGTCSACTLRREALC